MWRFGNIVKIELGRKAANGVFEITVNTRTCCFSGGDGMETSWFTLGGSQPNKTLMNFWRKCRCWAWFDMKTLFCSWERVLSHLTSLLLQGKYPVFANLWQLCICRVIIVNSIMFGWNWETFGSVRKSSKYFDWPSAIFKFLCINFGSRFSLHLCDTFLHCFIRKLLSLFHLTSQNSVISKWVIYIGVLLILR